MSELNPYPADPYRQGVAGTPYPSDSDVAVQSASGVSSAQNGYYSADDLGDQSRPFPAVSGGQMVPYPGGGQQPYSQAYGQPYSQQYPYPSPSYGPYPPYGQGVYWGRFTIHVGMRPTPSVGGRSGSVLRVSLRTACLSA